MASTPPQLMPGIGLRPGGERPDLEIDTSHDDPATCARQVLDRLANRPVAFAEIAGRDLRSAPEDSGRL